MSELSDTPPQTCPACGTLVDVHEAEPLALVPCPSCGEKVRAQRSFDHFLLVETLGIGGMGSVYKARDTRLDRFVALKLLHKELSADPIEAARLEQEARSTAAINHPNVVQVYSAGRAHGQIYLVMELVDHGSLDDLMAQHTRLPETQVIQAGIQVAKGLQAAHEKGLIHRDVKPANILFANATTAKIGDFGLAVAAGQKAEAQKEIWGTPYYVAPERLNNEPEDFRSDIYSLGATLFHALAGRPPLEGETTSASELRRLKDNPPDLRAVAPNVSREAARIINQMLVPDPAGRYASYADLIDELQRTAAGNDGRGGGGSRWLWGIAAAVTLAAIAGAGFYLMRPRRPGPDASLIPSATASTSPTPDRKAALQREKTEREREKKKLAAQTAEREAKEKKAREAERAKLFQAEAPGWEKALAEARTKIASYDFPAALAGIDAVQLSEASLSEAQAGERKKIGWLKAWKAELLADINGGRFVAPIQIGTAAYTGAAKADATRITFRLPPYGTAEVDWVKIPPPALLAMSTSLIKPAAPETADRQWLAAVFAVETGQAEAAHPLADAAAKAKPEYGDQLELLFPAEK